LSVFLPAVLRYLNLAVFGDKIANLFYSLNADKIPQGGFYGDNFLCFAQAQPYFCASAHFIRLYQQQGQNYGQKSFWRLAFIGFYDSN